MEEPINDNNGGRTELQDLRHDIRNQLSAIQLALEQLRYEIAPDSVDGAFYLDTISTSCVLIDTLLKGKD